MLVCGLILWYFLNVRPRPIDVSTSPGGHHNVKFVEVGSATFFGPSTVRLELTTDDRQVTTVTKKLFNDGARIDPSNWETTFEAHYVDVVLRGNEQPDEHIRLCYNTDKSC